VEERQRRELEQKSATTERWENAFVVRGFQPQGK
jgi:hypothetical protein